MKGVIAFITVLFVIPLAHAVTMVALKMPQNTHIAIVAVVLILATILIYLTKYIKSENSLIQMSVRYQLCSVVKV